MNGFSECAMSIKLFYQLLKFQGQILISWGDTSYANLQNLLEGRFTTCRPYRPACKCKMKKYIRLYCRRLFDH
jgi:hypothetical protein